MRNLLRSACARIGAALFADLPDERIIASPQGSLAMRSLRGYRDPELRCRVPPPPLNCSGRSRTVRVRPGLPRQKENPIEAQRSVVGGALRRYATLRLRKDERAAAWRAETAAHLRAWRSN